MQRHAGLNRATTIELGRRLSQRANRAAGRREPRWLVEVDDPAVEVIAVKAAHRGEGLVARLRNWESTARARPVRLRVSTDMNATIVNAWRIDSNERDIEELVIDAAGAHVKVDRYLTSVRLALRTSTSPETA
jgi:hypothetical protein